jgi:hypothetical protein
MPVIYTQVIKGGTRLGGLLNRIYGGGGSGSGSGAGSGSGSGDSGSGSGSGDSGSGSGSGAGSGGWVLDTGGCYFFVVGHECFFKKIGAWVAVAVAVAVVLAVAVAVVAVAVAVVLAVAGGCWIYNCFFLLCMPDAWVFFIIIGVLGGCGSVAVAVWLWQGGSSTGSGGGGGSGTGSGAGSGGWVLRIIVLIVCRLHWSSVFIYI